MQYAVYADFPRQLTSVERSAVGAALEENVPDDACVGLNPGPIDEVYFCVEATSDREAGEQAARYMSVVLRQAGLNDQYTLYIMPSRRGS